MFSLSKSVANLVTIYSRRIGGLDNVLHSVNLRLFSTATTATPGGSDGTGSLYDTFGRKHNYLRISLTEKCNLRCLYCMPEEGIELTANRQLLTTDEIKRISDLFVKTLGVNKIRLTGGEPLIRKDIIDIITHLSSLRPFGLKTIGLTTNGLILERMCRDLKSSGVTAINISLDTLDATKYEIITRRKGWHRVMRAIDTCLSAGFDSIKLNCVVIKGFNDTEVAAFVDLTRDRPLDVRFIEYMPFDGNRWASKKMVTYREMLAAVTAKHPTVRRLEPSLNETAKAYKVDGFRGQIGFITSMSDNFCGSCNRIRITADGNLKVCLFGNEEVSLRDAMRLDADDDTQLETVVRDALNRKHRRHAGAQNIANTPNRPMIRIAAHQWHRQSHHYQRLQQQQQVRQYSTGTDSGDQSLSHINHSTGEPQMVDIGGKRLTARQATAVGRVWVGGRVCDLIAANAIAKGQVLSVAKIAGIMAAKSTAQLIPLCHQINLDNVSIDTVVDREAEEVLITATAKTTWATGVEMEALVAVSTAALTVYDMCKAVNAGIVIREIRLVAKSGGKSDISCDESRV